MMGIFEPQVLLVLAIFTPFLTAACIYAFGAKPSIGYAGSLLTTFLVLGLAQHLLDGEKIYAQITEVLPNVGLAFELTGFGLVYAAMAAILWFVTLIYASGYMVVNNYGNLVRFYSFFAIAIFCALGIAFSANLLTMFIFYEAMTLCTYPLVTHKGTLEARRAARRYLGILMGASLLLFLPAIVWVYHITGSTDFVEGGLLAENGISGAFIPFLMLMFAFGIAKAGLFPVHKWLPAAMVAPTPVSALLHAVAVVKAGVFCITKVPFFTIGTTSLAGSGYELLGANNPVLFIAIATMLAASVFAIAKNNLKQRLAYSTIAQLAYIVIASAVLAPISMVAAGLHMVAHGVAKITLFFCAGAIATATGKYEVSQLDGVGRKLPLVCGAFFIASLSMIGLPYIAGGISKHYIVEAAEASHLGWVAWAFYASMLLNAIYYLPISYRTFIKKANVKVEKVLPRSIKIAISITAALTVLYIVYYQLIADMLQIGGAR